VQRLAEDAARLAGAPLAAARPLAGGDLSEVLEIRLADGRRLVAKTGPDPAAEAGMLRAIRAAGAPAPAVIAESPRVLVLEHLPAGGAMTDAAWADLGAALRRLHAARGDVPGWPVDHAFGAVAIRNTGPHDWPGFWAECRLRAEAPRLPGRLARRLDALADALADILPAAPPLSLLHGDLWTGNLLVHDGRVTGLIDPASYHGHGEVDLAMLSLFARPPDAFWHAYGRPSEGWARRCAVYQLWPAIVHLRLFGSGYRPLVERLLDAAGA